MFIGRRVSVRYFYQILIELKFSRQIFEKCFIIKIIGHPSSRSRVVACGQMDGQTDGHVDEQAQMTEPTVAFRSFAKAYRNQH